MTIQRFGIALLTVILVILFSCKERKPVQQIDETASTQLVPIPKAMNELLAFANLTAEEVSDLDKLFRFKLVNADGSVSTIETTEATKFVKRALSGKQTDTFFVETVSSEKAILFVQGRGYGGRIWGKLLLNLSNMTFEKIVFEHSAESEGYGAAMTLGSFENQFTNIDISADSFRFGLKQNTREILSGNAMIDGISGATDTAESVVEMVNNGLDKYKDYLSTNSQQ